MKIQAVVFDADGVVLAITRFSDYLEREYNLPQTETLKFFDGALEACLLGRADLKQTLAPFLVAWRWPGSVEDFIERWFSYANVVDKRVLEVIAGLRQRGLGCYLATNQEHERIRYMQTTMGFATIFDAIFFAAAIGCKKTDTAFYDHVTQRLGLKPEEILFWDDAPDNIATARSYGWHAEHYQDFADFTRRLSAYVEYGGGSRQERTE
jgi:putative hydrolase of the HAD superfamily